MAAPIRLAVSITRPLESVVFKQHKIRSSCNLKFLLCARKHSNSRIFDLSNSRLKRWLLAGSFAVTGVTLTAVYQRWSPFWFTLQAVSALDFRRPEVEPTRKVVVETDNSGLKLTLFQFQTCPFCCKVRAVLDYYGISYNIVEVNSVTKKQIKWSDYRKVPIVVVDGVGDNSFLQLNDSSVIISALESWRLDPNQSLQTLKECYVCVETEENGKQIVEYPNKYFIMYMDNENSSPPLEDQKPIENNPNRRRMIKEGADKVVKCKSKEGPLEVVHRGIVAGVFTPFTKTKMKPETETLKPGQQGEQQALDLNYTKKRREERKWRMWADNHLVHMLSPNIYRTPAESLQAFRYFSEVGEWERTFSTPERLMVIYTGATVMYLLSKMLKRKYNLKEDVRESLYDACKDWTKAVGKKQKFMGGDNPNLADLAVYGVLNSIEGCGAFEEAKNHSPGLGAWYRHMKAAVQSHAGAHLVSPAPELAISSHS